MCIKCLYLWRRKEGKEDERGRGWLKYAYKHMCVWNALNGTGESCSRECLGEKHQESGEQAWEEELFFTSYLFVLFNIFLPKMHKSHVFLSDKQENMDKFMKLPTILATFVSLFATLNFFHSFVTIMSRLKIFYTLQLLTRQFHF